MKPMTLDSLPEETGSPDQETAQVSNRLSLLLRVLGTGALLFGMYSFLARGWHNGDDLYRYLMMLGHTGVLAMVGLFTGHYLREGKGARLLLTLALVSVPINFSILGAFVFSQAVPEGLVHYPQYVAWQVDSLATALWTTGGAALLLLPVSVLAYSVLARSRFKPLSILFIASNLALLLPIRDPQTVAIFALSLSAAVVFLARHWTRGSTVTRTREGLLALALQLLPVGILMGRSLWLYRIDLFLLAVACATVFFVLHHIGRAFASDSRVRGLFDVLSLVPAVMLAPVVFELIDRSWVADLFALPAAALVSAALVMIVSENSATHSRFFRVLAVSGFTVCMLLNLLFNAGLIVALLSIAAGALLLWLGYARRQTSLFAGGLVLLIAGVVDPLFHLLQHFELSGWAGLALFGIVAIVAASLLESRGRDVREKLSEFRRTPELG